MKAILGLLLVLAGVVFGVWAGVWWAFIGGIVDFINACRAPGDLDATRVALDIFRVLFAGPVGWACGFLAVIPGLTLMGYWK